MCVGFPNPIVLDTRIDFRTEVETKKKKEIGLSLSLSRALGLKQSRVELRGTGSSLSSFLSWKSRWMRAPQRYLPFLKKKISKATETVKNN